MNFKPKKFTKILFLFFCFTFFTANTGFFLLTPQKVNAQAYVPVWEVGENLYQNSMNQYWNANIYWKEFIGDGVLWALVKELIVDRILEVILNKIYTQFGEQPAFATNPFILLRDIGFEMSDDVLNNLLDGYFADSFFGTEIQDILTDKNLSTDYQTMLDDIMKSTLEDDISSLGGNYDEFINGNFYEGGWGGFYSLTQHEKNNPFGSYFLSENALAQAKRDSESLVSNELSWGDGFLSKRKDGMITLPGKTIADQLNEVMADEQRTLEHADEITEIFALLAGALIGSLFDDAFSDGSFNLETDDDLENEQPIPDDDIGDIDMPGDGDTVTIDDQLTCFDVEGGSFQIAGGSLRGINLDAGDMEMIAPTINSADSTIRASQVTIPGTFNVVRNTGGQINIGSNDFPNWQPRGEYISVTNPTIDNPVFATLSSSFVDNTGSITDALVTNNPPVNPNLTGEASLMADAFNMCLMNAELQLDEDATSNTDYNNATIVSGDGNSITLLTDVTNLSSGSNSVTNDDLLRGGETEPGSITLDNVVLIGGTVTVGGTTYTIAGPSSGLYCSSTSLCSYPTVSGVEGSSLYINDTRNAWSIKSITWSEKEAYVSGSFDVYGGTVVGY